jgi:DNA-binding YbaB/EbfC family protein
MMSNMKKLMQQASTMQQDMKRVQEELASRTVEFSSGGGMVTATARGDGSLAELKIDPRVLEASDVEMMQDMVLAAVNGALEASRQLQSDEMSKITEGMGLPGLPGLMG